MKKYNINPISIAIIVMTVAFIILGRFSWLEERTFSIWAIDLGVTVESIDNNFCLCLINGLLSIAMLLIGKRWGLIISTVFSTINAIYSLKIPLGILVGKEVLSKIYDLDITYVATTAGYLALAISWIIIILQIVLLVLTFSKKGGMNK